MATKQNQSKRKGASINGFHIFCKKRAEEGKNVIYRKKAAHEHAFTAFSKEWRQISTAEKGELKMQACQEKNQVDPGEIIKASISRQLDKMSARTSWKCAAIFISPEGQVSLHGRMHDGDLATFLAHHPVLKELSRMYSRSEIYQPQPLLREQLAKKLNDVAARDLRKDHFPYMACLEGKIIVEGVPACCWPLQKPSSYGKEKLKLLLEADIKLRRPLFESGPSSISSAPTFASSIVQPSTTQSEQPSLAQSVQPFLIKLEEPSLTQFEQPSSNPSLELSLITQSSVLSSTTPSTSSPSIPITPSATLAFAESTLPASSTTDCGAVSAEGETKSKCDPWKHIMDYFHDEFFNNKPLQKDAVKRYVRDYNSTKTVTAIISKRKKMRINQQKQQKS